MRFLFCAITGFLVTCTALLLLTVLEPGQLAIYQQWREALAGLWQAATRNLQGSIVLFVVVFWAYLHQLYAMSRLLQRRQPPVDMVLRREQLLDLCASLFFGIGVIWTAIGMRGALLFALGDTAQVSGESGMAVLQRLVDGGILLALSTTIVGGIGGYLMRAGKQLLFGRQLAAVYLRASRNSAGDSPASKRPEIMLSEEPIL